MFALSFRQSLKTLLRFRLPFPARRGRSALLRFGQQWTAVEGLEVRALLAATFGGPNTITADANGARAVFSADVDGDGDLDVLSASAAFNGSEIAWYENDGSQNFTPHTITTSADGAYSVFAADVDGDGDLDVLSASLNDNRIAWY